MRNKIFTFVAAFAASAGLFTAQAQKLGDEIEVDGVTYKMGVNLITNGSFEDGLTGWENGAGSPLGSGFTLNTTGGVDDGAYIVATENKGKDDVASIGTAWRIESGVLYYFAYSLKSMGGATGTPYLVTALDNEVRGDEPVKLFGDGATEGSSLYGNPVVTADGEWCKNEVTFTNTDSYQYLSCNFRWMSGQWGLGNFYLAKLIPADEFDELQVYIDKLDLLRDEISIYTYESEDMQELSGLNNVLSERLNYSYVFVDVSTIEAIETEMIELQEAFDKAKAGIQLYKELSSLLLECGDLQNEGYPGADDFGNAIASAQEFINNSDVSTYEDYETGLKELEEARTVYLYSQEATMDNPANYTFLIDGPSFWDPKCGLTEDELNADNRKTWENIDSWINGSISVSMDQFRSNYYGGRPCWNSWSNNFTSMDIHQDLTGLPNGYYAVKCNAMTQEGRITDQHAYVKSAAGIEVSSPMTIDGYWDTPEGWEEMTTGMIAVVDGKLSIGFASTSGGEQSGWFCVTDFTLLYFGEGEISLNEILNARIAEANALESSLKGDRKALEGALAIAEQANTDEQIKAALDTINAGMEIVKASNLAYTQFEEKNLNPAVEAAELLSGMSQEVMNNIISRTKDYLESATATSAEMTEVYAPALTNYKSYADALAKAEELDITGAYEGNVEELNTTIDSQTTYLANNITGKETIDWYIQQLNNNILAVNASIFAQEAKEKGSDYDFTGLIQNPDAAAETGWVINKGVGNTNTGSGQHYTGDGTRRYFDSWNGTTGALNYTAYQEINFLPNGNYTLKVAARSSCENDGAKLLVSTGTNANDTIWESIVCSFDKGGSIWQTAYDEDPDSELAMVHPDETSGEFIGWGWNWHEITFDVKDHQLSIGMSTDSLITHVPFTGTWFSVVDFQLTMNSYGDNGDNFDWITGIEETTTGEATQLVVRVEGKRIYVTNASGEAVNDFKVYNITGTEVNPTAEQSAGIYIVKVGRQVTKVAVK